MVLLTGGAFQGKTEFARRELLHITGGREEEIREMYGAIVDGSSCSMEEAAEASLLAHYHLLIRRQMKDNADPFQAIGELLFKNPDLIITVDELGCGIVPVDAFDRAWREVTGRCCCLLAKRADAVYRVTCGIGTRIK